MLLNRYLVLFTGEDFLKKFILITFLINLSLCSKRKRETKMKENNEKDRENEEKKKKTPATCE